MASKSKITEIHTNIFSILIFGLILRFFLAFIFSNDVSFLGGVGSNDAKGFSMYAKDIYFNFSISSLLQGMEYNIYPVILSIIYKFTFPSDFIGNSFSVIIWAHSFFIINKLLNYFNYSKISIFLSLAYFTLSPTICIYSSLSLRDFLIFYLILNLIYFIFRFQNNKKFLDLVIIFFINILIFKLHENFLLLFIIFLFIFYFSYKFYQLTIKHLNINIYILITFFILLFCILNLIQMDYIFYSLNNFQAGSIADPTIGRANYIVTPYSINDMFGFIYYIFRNFFLYLVEPSYLNIEKIIFNDFILVFEKFFKIIIIILLILYYLKNKGEIGNQRLTIFLFLFLADLSFSLGTFNWGTAFRHQVITFGLLPFMIAFVYENTFIKNEK